VRRAARLIAAALLAAPLLSGCAGGGLSLATAPRCTSLERLALIAQSVPTSSYVPCITQLATGWRTDGLVVQDGSARFAMISDRAAGHPVQVELHSRCDPSDGAPIPPRTPGGRTYLALHSIDPRFTGAMYDVFPGGCVTYRFDFQRGPHIALMAELQSSVGLVSRAELALSLREELGVELS
jgi:hypothetical protein